MLMAEVVTIRESRIATAASQPNSLHQLGFDSSGHAVVAHRSDGYRKPMCTTHGRLKLARLPLSHVATPATLPSISKIPLNSSPYPWFKTSWPSICLYRSNGANGMSDMAGKAVGVVLSAAGAAEIQWSEWNEYRRAGKPVDGRHWPWESDRADREIASQRPPSPRATPNQLASWRRASIEGKATRVASENGAAGTRAT